MLFRQAAGHLPNSSIIASLRIYLTTKCPFVKRRWDDEVVVFDELTGDTHLLGGLAGRIFEIVSSSRVSDEELRCALEETAHVNEVGPPPEQISRAVAELRMLGLVM
jgi:PqqD family protein of HPr-rel-A system